MERIESPAYARLGNSGLMSAERLDGYIGIGVG